MEPYKNISTSFKTVTPFSKYLAMVVMIILPFLGGYIGYKYAPERTIEAPVKEEKVAVQETKTNAADMPAMYTSSKYRVVRVVSNPYYSEDSKYDDLVIASLRGTNDDSCGGSYSNSVCYLFLESSYYGIETPKFVGTWNGEFPILRPDTVKFISPTVVEFEAAGGDAGYRIETKWRLDVTTASSTLVTKKETNEEV